MQFEYQKNGVKGLMQDCIVSDMPVYDWANQTWVFLLINPWEILIEL